MGNAVESTWKIYLDTDEVTKFELDYDPSDPFYTMASIDPDFDGWYRIYNDCEEKPD